MRDLKSIKVIVERHTDGYVAYPVGMQGVVVAEGDTYAEALAEIKSAIEFHIETFGVGILEIDEPALDVFVAETAVAV